MRYLTPDPDLHSTDEVIRSYHEHHGDIDLRSYWPKMLASVTTISFGGSVGLEGPSIFAGGGVGAMFVPLLLLGEALGRVFGQSIVHAQAVDLYCAIGMAAFIAAGYKTPLAAAAFVAETTGTPAYLIPTLIGAAVAYAASGEASVVFSQRLRQTPKLSQPVGLRARQIMRTQMVGAQADATLQEFFANVAANNRHPAYPVFEGKRAIGIISLWEIAQVPASRWNSVKVGEVARANLAQVELDTDLREVVRLMNQQQRHRLVLIIDSAGAPAGLITPSDILFALSVEDEAETGAG